jgi:hypothetical protein
MMPARIQRLEARVLAEREFARFAALVGSLSDHEWTLPTGEPRGSRTVEQQL